MKSRANGGLSASHEKYSRDNSHTATTTSTYLSLTELIDDRNDKKAERSTFIVGEKISSEAKPPCLSVENTNFFPEDSANDNDFAEKLHGEKISKDLLSERECYFSESTSMYNENEQVNFYRG